MKKAQELSKDHMDLRKKKGLFWYRGLPTVSKGFFSHG